MRIQGTKITHVKKSYEPPEKITTISTQVIYLEIFSMMLEKKKRELEIIERNISCFSLELMDCRPIELHSLHWA
jgi:hypothetical protein